MLYKSADVSKETLEKKISEFLAKPQVASLATVHEGKPWVRYMVVFPAGENFTLATSTFMNSRKVTHLQNNPHIHITMGPAATDPKFMGGYIQFEGTAEVKTDTETRHKYWNEHFKTYYSGPDDPNYVILIFKPTTIELWGAGEDMTIPYVWKA